MLLFGRCGKLAFNGPCRSHYTFASSVQNAAFRPVFSTVAQGNQWENGERDVPHGCSRPRDSSDLMKNLPAIHIGAAPSAILRNPPPLVVLLPAVMVGAALLLPPLYLAVRTFGGGEELWDLLFRPRVASILGRTILLVVSVSASCVLLSLPLAWLTVRTDLPWRQAWAVITSLPLVIPSYVAGFVVVVTLGPRGMLQSALEGPFGVDRLPSIYGFAGAFLTLTLLSYPYVLLTLRAAMQKLDPAFEESARNLGMGPLATFVQVVIPLLRPAIGAGVLLVGLYTLSDFGAVSLMRYETFTWAIFTQYESALDRTLGAGLSLALIVLALAWVALEFMSRGRSRYYSSSSGTTRPPPIVSLGRWRWPSLGFCATITLFSLGLPVGILVYWVVRGVAAGEPLDPVWTSARNSVYISALAALATTAAAMPVALLSVRHPAGSSGWGILSGILERLGYVSFALPGIAIALALVFFGANYAGFLYQTVGMLLLGYMALFLSPALGAVRATLVQVNPRVEEAARSLGRSPLGALTSVTIPVARPGIMAGAALVFLLTMKELPATLLLSPTGFDTLATSVWSFTSEAFFARAAMPALLLIVLSGVPLALMTLRERR